MDIERLTVREVRELAVLAAGLTGGTCKIPDANPYASMMGRAIFIRTVTHHFTGRLIEVHPQELVLEDAAWIADDGRFAQAMETGQFAEIEPYPAGRVIVGRGAIVDVYCYGKEPPRGQK